MKLDEASVLIVDDEPVLREIFAKWLSKAGCCSVRTAAHGEEALDAIRQQPVDVLITDVRMPVMDGVTLVRRLFAQGERLHTIIFVSGFGEVDLREMYDLGVDSFLTKPFRVEELAEAVDKALADRALLWASPMELAPRQTLHLAPPSAPVEQVLRANVGKSDAPPPFLLGRGGFSARTEEPLVLGKVSFRCALSSSDPEDSGKPDLCGQGFVRWRSKLDQAVGIEFAFLESPGREWVVQQIAKENLRSFLPALKAGSGSG